MRPRQQNLSTSSNFKRFSSTAPKMAPTTQAFYAQEHSWNEGLTLAMIQCTLYWNGKLLSSVTTNACVVSFDGNSLMNQCETREPSQVYAMGKLSFAVSRQSRRVVSALTNARRKFFLVLSSNILQIMCFEWTA